MANILGRQTLDTLEILEVDEIPSTNSGTVSTVGSLALYNGSMYLKYGVLDTDWRQVIATGTSSSTTYQMPITDGTNGQGLITNGNGIMSWATTNISGPNNTFLFDDFISNATASLYGWVGTVNGTGSGVALDTTPVNTTDKALGAMRIITGTTTTGRACCSVAGGSQLLLGYCAINIEWRVLPAQLSTATDEFIIRFGLFDTTGAGDAVDGVYFEYDRTQSVNWRICTSSNSTRTKTNTTVAVTNTFSKFRCSINATGTSVSYFINDVNVGTITLNIPITAGRFTNPAIKIDKSAGTSTRACYADYCMMTANWSTPRN